MFGSLAELLIARLRLQSLARPEAETLILHQQVIVLSRKSAWRVLLRCIDRLTFVRLYRLLRSLLKPISVAQPGEVIRRYRRGFRACC
jgi:hypothetical protein